MDRPIPTSTKQPRRRWLHNISVGVLIGLSCLALAIYAGVRWIERQILTPDNWVTMVTPLPKNPEVSSALGGYVTTQVFKQVPLQQQISDALPPKAAFLASPLSDQIKNIANRQAVRLVASDQFQDIWVAANRAAMGRLVATARGQPTPLQQKLPEKFSLDLSKVQGQLGGKLGSAATAVPSLDPAKKEQLLSLQADVKLKRERLQQTVKTLDTINKVLPYASISFPLAALAVAYSRRRALMGIAIITGVIALIELIVIKAMRPQVLDQVKDPSYHGAVGVLYDTVVQSLNHSLYALAAVALVVLIGCVLDGPAKWAIAFRSLVRLDRLKRSRPMGWWYAFRMATGHYRYYLWAGLALITLVYLAFIATISGPLVINSLFVLLAGIAVVQLVGTVRQNTLQPVAR